MWVMARLVGSRFEALASVIVASKRDVLPVLFMQLAGISGMKLMFVGLACLVIVFVRGPSDG